MNELANKFVFQWHITNRCSNRCRHCYIDKFGKNDVDIKTVNVILNDMRDCADRLEAKSYISFTGGDPLMHPNIWEILKKAKEMDFEISMLGNPEFLDETNIKKLIDVGIFRYQLSFDGMEKTHDENRSKGSFCRTTNALSLAVKLGLPVVAMSTISSINYLEMPDVMKHVYKTGGERWTFARFIPDFGDCGISPKNFEAFLRLIVKEHAPFEKESSGHLFPQGKTMPKKEPLISPIISKIEGSEEKILGGCGLGTSLLVVLPDNTIMACRRHRGSVLGKWKKSGDILNFFLFSPKMNEYRNIKQIENCKDCGFLNQCRGCRAAAFASCGDSFGKDPQCFLA